MGSLTFAVLSVVVGTIPTNARRSGRMGSGTAVVTSRVLESTTLVVTVWSPKNCPATSHAISGSRARSIE
jgi:hypothetical protein